MQCYTLSETLHVDTDADFICEQGLSLKKNFIGSNFNLNICVCLFTGDNMLTAISVARQCGMVPGREAIILVNVHPPENDKPASIEWEYADVDNRENEVSDTESTDEGPTPDTEGVSKLEPKYFESAEKKLMKVK